MCRLILGGTGGQGILTLGRLIANAAMLEGLNVTCYPVYGAEMRGGYTFSSLTIDTREIASPIIARAGAGIFLARFALEYLGPLVSRGGPVVVSADLVSGSDANCRRACFPLNAARVARELGDERCANMVAAGFLARKAGDYPARLSPFPTLPALKTAVATVFPGKPAVQECNLAALGAGFDRAAGSRPAR